MMGFVRRKQNLAIEYTDEMVSAKAGWVYELDFAKWDMGGKEIKRASFEVRAGDDEANLFGWRQERILSHRVGMWYEEQTKGWKKFAVYKSKPVLASAITDEPSSIVVIDSAPSEAIAASSVDHFPHFY